MIQMVLFFQFLIFYKKKDEENENIRRETGIKNKLGDEGYKKYKELNHKIYEAKNLN